MNGHSPEPSNERCLRCGHTADCGSGGIEENMTSEKRARTTHSQLRTGDMDGGGIHLVD